MGTRAIGCAPIRWCAGTRAAGCGGATGGPGPAALVLALRLRRRRFLVMATRCAGEVSPTHGTVDTGEAVTSMARRAVSRYGDWPAEGVQSKSRSLECSIQRRALDLPADGLAGKKGAARGDRVELLPAPSMVRCGSTREARRSSAVDAGASSSWSSSPSSSSSSKTSSRTLFSNERLPIGAAEQEVYRDTVQRYCTVVF